MGSLKDSGYIIIEFYWKTNYHTAEGGGGPSPLPIPSQKIEEKEGKGREEYLHYTPQYHNQTTHTYTLVHTCAEIKSTGI